MSICRSGDFMSLFPRGLRLHGHDLGTSSQVMIAKLVLSERKEAGTRSD